MEDAIPLIFQQLPATTGFVQNHGHFFKSLTCQAQNGVTGERKKKGEEGKSRSNVLKLKSELEIAAYLSHGNFSAATK